MGPLKLEQFISNIENSLLQFILNRKFAFLYLTLIFFAAMFFLSPLWTHSQFPSWTKFFVAQDRYWALMTLLIGAYISYWVNSKLYFHLLLVFFISTSWLLPIYQLGSLRWEAVAPIIYILINSFFIGQFRQHFQKGLVVFSIASYLSLVIFLGFDVLQNKDGRIFQYFSLLHLQMILFYFISRILRGPQSSFFDFNPLQLFSPLPLPEESQHLISGQEKKSLFYKGTLQILEAQALFLLLMFVFKFTPETTQKLIIFQFYSFLFFITASMKTLTALLWMYGFKTPSVSYFLILAKSPLETWQRGSVFMAKFIFSVIYFPLWKKFRNHFFPIVACVVFVLFNLFIFHEVILGGILSSLFPTLQFVMAKMASIKQQVLWAALWILWIFIFEYTFNKMTFLKKTALGHWLLIALTHAGNMSIIPLTIYLLNI